MALAGHLHYAQLRYGKNLALGFVLFHLVAQTLIYRLPIFAAFHVYGIQNNQSAKIAQANLPRSLGDSLQVRVENEIFAVGVLALMGAGVDVYRNKSFGFVDYNLTAGWQRNPPLESLGYLALYIIALKWECSP